MKKNKIISMTNIPGITLTIHPITQFIVCAQQFMEEMIKLLSVTLKSELDNILQKQNGYSYLLGGFKKNTFHIKVS